MPGHKGITSVVVDVARTSSGELVQALGAGPGVRWLQAVDGGLERDVDSKVPRSAACERSACRSGPWSGRFVADLARTPTCRPRHATTAATNARSRTPPRRSRFHSKSPLE